MMKSKRKAEDFNYPLAIVVFAGAAVLLVLLSLKLNDSSWKPANQAALQENQQAPEFTFPNLDGKMIRLSDYRGKILLLNIWATWCPSCVAEMPSIQKLYNKFKDRNFEILAVSIDEQGREAVAPFIKKQNLTFPVLLDPQAKIKTPYGLTGIPESFVIDKAGIIIKKIIGPIDWATSETFRFFDQLIEQPMPEG